MGAALPSIIGLFDGSPMRGLAVGLWAGISGVGIVLGPVIGGILLQRFAWDSVFWVCAVIGMLAICAAFLCLFGFIFLTTQWFQALRGCSALETAIATLPFAVVMAVMAAGIALVQGPATDALMTAVPVGEEGMGSAVNDTIRELGGTLGVGIMGSLQAGAYTTGLTDALRRSHLPQGILGASKESVMAAESISSSLPGTLRRLLDGSVASAFMDGLHSVCLAAMTIALIAAVGCDRGHAKTAVMACTHPRITDMTQSQPRSRRTPTLEIRGRILDAARRIVEQDGVDGLTIRTLSAQADVSPTSIYQHIGGKQAVSDALIDAYFTDLREQLIAIDESDPVLRLRRAGMIYREHALDAPGIYALVWMGQASDSAQHCLDAITQIIRYGQAAAVFRDDDPHLIASSIWVSIHGFIQFELRSAQPRTRGRERVDRSYGYLLDLLIRGIRR